MSLTHRHATVVCSVLEKDVESSARRIAEAPRGCGLVELRADRLRAAEVARLVRDAARPLIVTVRSKDHGGLFEGSESERRAAVEAAMSAGASFIDVEHGGSLADLARGEQRERIVLSHHGAACRTSDLIPLLRSMAATGAARLKIVPSCRTPGELSAVRELLADAKRHGAALASFAVGRAGVVSRLLACAWGSWATYGATRPGAETAAGQLTARELIEVHDVLGTRAATRRFALVGSGVSSSPSPAMHNAAYRDTGIDARYLPLELERLDEVDPLLGTGGVAGIEAFGVTIPFKEDAARRSAPGDAVARACGAVNTVRVATDGWQGYNTDGPAALRLVSRACSPRGARVAVLGAGGTARAVAAAFAGAGSRVTIFNRTQERGERVARALGVQSGSWTEMPGAEWDVLVNATPLGAAGETLLAPDRIVGRVVLDAVYSARPTPLVATARDLALHVIDGLELLTAQAVLQFQRMTGADASADRMRRAGRRWLRDRSA